MRIALKNWMSHAHLDVEITTPVAFVVGKNRRGKTAIRDALEFLFLGTGELRGIPTKKALAALAIRDGATSTEATLETPRLRLRRTMNRKAEQSLWRASRASADAPWGDEEIVPLDEPTALLGADEDLIRCLLEPTAFYRLKPARRRELLIAATSDASTSDAIREAIEAATGDSSLAAAELADLAARAGFRAAEEHAVAQRQQAKRDLAALPPAEPPPSAWQDPETGRTLDLTTGTPEQHQAQLAALRAERQALAVDTAVDRATLEARLAEAEAAWRSLAGEATAAPDSGAAKNLEQAEADVTAAEEALAPIRAEIEAARATAHLDAATWERPTTCPAVPALPDGTGMPCPVKPATFQKHLEKLPKTRQEAQKRLDALEADRNARLEGIAALKAARDRARARAEAETARAAAEAERDRRAEELEARVADLARQVAQAREAGDGGEAKAKAEALDARIALGERFAAAARDHREAQRQAEERAQQRAHREAAIARWDALAQALKPTGIETTLGGGAREAFLGHLSALEGLVGPIRITEDFELEAAQEGAWRGILQVSESHQHALGIAIQHALAQMVRFPLLVCDALDRHDAHGRTAWFEAARAIADRYPAGVLGLATTTTEPPGTPPDGASTIWLRPDGLAQTLGAEGL